MSNYYSDDPTLRAAFEKGTRHYRMPATARMRGVLDVRTTFAERAAFSAGWKHQRAEDAAAGIPAAGHRAQDHTYTAMTTRGS